MFNAGIGSDTPQFIHIGIGQKPGSFGRMDYVGNSIPVHQSG